MSAVKSSTKKREKHWRKGLGARHTFLLGVEGKECSKCRQWKSLVSFNTFRKKWDGLSAQCKQCSKEYQEEHKDEKESKRKAKFLEDPEYFRRLNRTNKQEQYARNPEKFREITKRKRKNDHKYIIFLSEYRSRIDRRIHSNISRAMRAAMTQRKNGRRWETLVGYTVYDLMEHLESLFREGMSWDNYGAWEIDHIKPLASFSITSYEDENFKKCWGLENLQPLWMSDNRRKWAHIR